MTSIQDVAEGRSLRYVRISNVILRARWLIESRGWTQDGWAKALGGYAVSEQSKEAYYFSLGAAIFQSSFENKVIDMGAVFLPICLATNYENPLAWDTQPDITKEQVLAVLLRASELPEAQMLIDAWEWAS